LSVADAYLCTTECLNLAEKFQIPVILMSDLYLSEHMETVDREALPFPVPIERGEVAHPGSTDVYRRYADTPSGVSPRTVPGTPFGLHVASTDEHNEKGELISDVFTNPTTRARMVEKRQRKLEGLAREPRALVREGADRPALTLVGWGSTYQILREARLALEKEGVSVAHVQFRRLWPFPSEEARRALGDPAKSVVVENNVSGQFSRLLRQETGISVPRHVRKYDGEPFNLPGLLDALKKILDGSAPEIQRLVSSELDIPVHHLGGGA
jgi:2-oxoglutarate ferredoxin oxidoreductase subunit alpha